MDKKELEFILEEGEGLKIEFKKGFDAKELAIAIVALSNSDGGRIFFGIDDNGIIKGIHITNKLKSEIQSIARNCDPPVNIKLKAIDNILIINAEEGINKPYRCSAGFFFEAGQ